jgi:hypothetical protein
MVLKALKKLELIKLFEKMQHWNLLFVKWTPTLPTHTCACMHPQAKICFSHRAIVMYECIPRDIPNIQRLAAQSCFCAPLNICVQVRQVTCPVALWETPSTPENSVFGSINTKIQVKIVTKVVYIYVNHDMFRPLLGHHQVYLCVLRSSILSSVQTHIFLHIWLHD